MLSSLGVLDDFSVTDRNRSSLSFNCVIQESWMKKKKKKSHAHCVCPFRVLKCDGQCLAGNV